MFSLCLDKIYINLQEIRIIKCLKIFQQIQLIWIIELSENNLTDQVANFLIYDLNKNFIKYFSILKILSLIFIYYLLHLKVLNLNKHP